MRTSLLACLAFVVAPAPALSAQQTADVIRGRVTTDSADRPIAGALVAVTPVGTQATRTTQTDSAGRYLLRLSPAAAEYALRISAAGRQTVTQRVARTAGSDTITFDARLTRSVQTLTPVVTVATPRLRPAIVDQGGDPSIGSAATGISGMVFDPAQRGDLAVMAAAAPGITLVPGAEGGAPSFSYMGLSPAQNNVTLNGMNLTGTTMPAAALTQARFQATGSDPSVGGFSGGLLAVSMASGGNISQGNLMLMFDNPALQLTDATGRALGQQYSNMQVSAGRSGALVRDKLTYNVAAQLGRRSNDAITIFDANETALQRTGVSPLTAQRFAQTLDAIGARPAIDINDVSTINGSALGRFDILPRADRSMNITTSFSRRRSSPTLLGALTADTRAGELTTTSGSIAGEFAKVVEDFYVTRTKAGLSLQRSVGEALQPMPEGRVLAPSVLPNGTTGLATLQFGGSPLLPTFNQQLIGEVTHETSWYLPGNAHRPKLALGWRGDSYDNRVTQNQLGSFTFNSLDDLAANRPSAFRRTLRGGNWSAASDYVWFAASDMWRVTNRVALQYGFRAEGNRFRSAPEHNPLVESVFGLNTGEVPAPVAVLPRLGLNWQVGNTRSITGGTPTPSGSVRATAGGYRNVMPVSIVGSAMNGTGLPGSIERITCLGPATPMPDWERMLDPSNIPEECADGSTGFADTRTNVIAFADDYDAPTAWRASVGVSRFELLKMRVLVDATYSLNVNLPATLDYNFAGSRDYALASEGNRVIYADPSNIHAATGTIDPLVTRADARFSRVSALMSDGRSEAKQVSLTLQPNGLNLLRSRFFFVTYALGGVRDRVRGFDAPTTTDPRTATWGTSTADIRHSVVATMSWGVGSGTFISLSGQFRSGTPFTPLVQGDVNGDGLMNDPAFVFDRGATGTGDSEFDAAFDELMTSGPSTVRDCLSRQVGMVAARNSCRGPWTAAMYFTINATARDLGLPSRARISFILNNPLGAVDQLLHGSEKLRGWGQPAFPDQVLYAVTGYDHAAQRFRYRVNPGFGDTRPNRSAIRTPFGLSIQVNMPIVPTTGRQTLNDVLAPGRTRTGTMMTAAQVKQRYANSFYQPITQIIAARDSLFLTAEQVTALRAIQQKYALATDSVWTKLAAELATVGARYSQASELERVRQARQRAFDALEVAAQSARASLTPEQIDQLSIFVQNLLDAKEIARMRRNDIDY